MCRSPVSFIPGKVMSLNFSVIEGCSKAKSYDIINRSYIYLTIASILLQE